MGCQIITAKYQQVRHEQPK